MIRDDVKVDDVIQVHAQGLIIVAKVATVDYYYEDGWQIEMEDIGGQHTYRSWKQRCDGGMLTRVNDIDIKHQCKDCLNAGSMDSWFRGPCKDCSMNKNWRSAHNVEEEEQHHERTAQCGECRTRHARSELQWVNDRYGIPFKLVCDDCHEKVQDAIDEWEFDQDDAGECLDDDY